MKSTEGNVDIRVFSNLEVAKKEYDIVAENIEVDEELYFQDSVSLMEVGDGESFGSGDDSYGGKEIENFPEERHGA